MIKTIQTFAGPVQLVPQEVCDNPTLNIFKATSMTLVVGPNGAGKTRMLSSIISSVLDSDDMGADCTNYRDTLVVYYSPLPCNIELPRQQKQFENLQNGIRAEKTRKEPNLNVLKDIARQFGLDTNVVIQFFSPNNVYKEVHSLLTGRGGPDPTSLPYPHRFIHKSLGFLA
ncbi:hypothetical protein SAMN02982985_04931 [Rugamonas rubra]|uniref:AAA domain-containing protein n=2 Tax=Rugamonas rubra TaxID=758825 RepID=A0A1I4SVB6_9BURK|nr:hypothetical protein SAMN02982985_04931 [Rugamonas rubra]